MVDQLKRHYFGTDGIRGRVGVWPVTPDFVLKLGWAVGCVLTQQGLSGKVLIGKDTRISGYMFESALEAGLAAAGVDIHLLGPMPTPAVAYLTRTLRARAGIVISASHNPYYDNGIKFFSSQGYKLPDEMEVAIEAQMKQPMTTVDSARLGKAIRIVDAPGRYIEFCKSTVSSDVSLKGLKIVVDCANGAAYHIAPNVFTELGAEVIEVSSEPNGLNINQECGATHVGALRELVLREKADLGLALDGDADRVMMVDHVGDTIDGDVMLYIMAKHLHAAGMLKGGIVGTVMANLGLEQAIKKLGVEFVRVPVGDRHISAELRKRRWHLGGEPSGHMLCSDALTTGDGIITALQILSIMHYANLSLHDLKKDFVRYPQTLINVKVSELSDPAQFPAIQKAL
ncbi:MAG: phosphoglucosamine mutase, partial [Gammaproteobacteria bacterium]|nr:phosphoglucosamine mutase [Gammaproteobacteria bacterium]